MKFMKKTKLKIIPIRHKGVAKCEIIGYSMVELKDVKLILTETEHVEMQLLERDYARDGSDDMREVKRGLPEWVVEKNRDRNEHKSLCESQKREHHCQKEKWHAQVFARELGQGSMLGGEGTKIGKK